MNHYCYKLYVMISFNKKFEHYYENFHNHLFQVSNILGDQPLLLNIIY